MLLTEPLRLSTHVGTDPPDSLEESLSALSIERFMMLDQTRMLPPPQQSSRTPEACAFSGVPAGLRFATTTPAQHLHARDLPLISCLSPFTSHLIFHLSPLSVHTRLQLVSRTLEEHAPSRFQCS